MRHASAGHADTDRVPTGLARAGLPDRLLLIVRVAVMVPLNYGGGIVMVRSRPVVVIRVIVAYVFMDVQRRRH
ncbi:MAG TPA: hypothetical protein VFS23_11030 [Vicinamibacterales bacterium]|nr:hypothetical protein [Vicinamibacterales bacterium]